MAVILDMLELISSCFISFINAESHVLLFPDTCVRWQDLPQEMAPLIGPSLKH